MRRTLACDRLIWLGLLGAMACGDDPAGATSQGPKVTYHGAVRGLVETHCTSCHQQGGIAPFPLQSWQDVQARAAGVASAVESGAMPPWHYDDACRDIASDAPRMTDDERALFGAWRDAQFAEGKVSEYRAPKPNKVAALGKPELRLLPAKGYAPNAELVDDYRCLPLEQEFAQDTFVVATGIRPERAELVHHVIVYAIPAAARDKLKKLDESEAGPGFACFGDAGIEEAEMVAGWAPGGSDGALPPGTALRITAGAQLVMQVHYNVGAGHSHSDAGKTEDHPGTPPTDRSELALWTMPQGKTPKQLLTFVPAANLDILIRAGDKASTQVSERKLILDATIIGVAPHMHLLGTSIRTELERADGTRECLTDIPKWDFHWQRDYFFAKGSEVKVGVEDTIRLTCVYDNSDAHQPPGSGKAKDVRWGEGTGDEMCLDYLLVVAPYRPSAEVGTCSGYRPCAADCATNDATCHFACMAGLGQSCLTCGLDVVVGPCAERHCLDNLITFGDCFEGCPSQDTDDFGSCLADWCKAESDALFVCMKPALDAGLCAPELNSCGGIEPAR